MPPASKENIPPTSAQTLGEDALHPGPRKKPSRSDPLIHHGRHFGRSVHAFCNVKTLLTNGVLRLGELADEPEEAFTSEQRREHRVFKLLLSMVPGLEERLFDGDEEDLIAVASCLQKGVNSARSDDTKSMKGPILDWITPPGSTLRPPIARNKKSDRGFFHDTTGALLCPADLNWEDAEIKLLLQSDDHVVPGDQWPIFLFAGNKYDTEDPWSGLFRSRLLVTAYKHVFTSPSSVERETKATRSGNALLHGMTQVTPASLAYIATQTRFALHSQSIFTRNDKVTDSARFYSSIIEWFDDPEERSNVDSLLEWWNRQIFPSYSSARRPLPKTSVLAKMKEKRAERRAAAALY